MTDRVVLHMSADPQKLIDLQWLEEELHDVIEDDLTLDWNQQHHCVEHQFSDEYYDLEYCILEHWAGHVGAEFKMAENREGAYSAYIYR